MNDELSIAIPTFNRPEILYENLLFQLPELKKYEIGIYISDDSTNNETKKVVEDLSAEYPNIFYIKNNPSLGHDKNFLSTLELPSTNYVWLLGDSMTIESGAIGKVLNIIKINSPSIIGVNYKDRIVVKNEVLRSGLKKEQESIFINFGWHLTLTGATIYSKDVIQSATSLDLLACKNFPQISLIFTYLNDSPSFYWLEDNLLFSQGKKKSYWSGNIMDVFIHDLSRVVYKLPRKYGLESKNEFMRCHSKKSKLFTIRNLVKMRLYDEIDSKIAIENKNLLATFTDIPFIVVFLISILPKRIIFLYVTVMQYFDKNRG